MNINTTMRKGFPLAHLAFIMQYLICRNIVETSVKAVATAELITYPPTKSAVSDAVMEIK